MPFSVREERITSSTLGSSTPGNHWVGHVMRLRMSVQFFLFVGAAEGWPPSTYPVRTCCAIGVRKTNGALFRTSMRGFNEVSSEGYVRRSFACVHLFVWGRGGFGTRRVTFGAREDFDSLFLSSYSENSPEGY